VRAALRPLAPLQGHPSKETRRLNEQVRRNEARFPEDFAFQLTPEDLDNLKSQFATSSFQPADILPTRPEQ
jgi:hypothetical protein